MVDKFTVGNVEIGAVLDMIPPPRDPRDFFPEVTKEDWTPYESDVLVNGQFQLYCGHFFVRSQGKTIMVDTGMGPGPHATRGNRTGNLINQLAAKGIRPEDVDMVVHTHLHADHVGWNLDLSKATPRPNFPNARYLVPRDDWDHFTRPENLSNAPWVRDSVVPLEALGLMDFFGNGYSITNEVTTLATPGHTPGHVVVLVSSQGQRAMIVGDVLHSKVQVQQPSWCAAADTNKSDSMRSREDLLRRAETQDYIVAAGHFPLDAHVGRVVARNGRRYWQPL
ncbi:MAG: MBL fold metallo-hydrolase [Chloroflexi bacterium]|nr:MBL fold metallo-hydrolase [Chloroflexota bacterium]